MLYCVSSCNAAEHGHDRPRPSYVAMPQHATQHLNQIHAEHCRYTAASKTCMSAAEYAPTIDSVIVQHMDLMARLISWTAVAAWASHQPCWHLQAAPNPRLRP